MNRYLHANRAPHAQWMPDSCQLNRNTWPLSPSCSQWYIQRVRSSAIVPCDHFMRSQSSTNLPSRAGAAPWPHMPWFGGPPARPLRRAWAATGARAQGARPLPSMPPPAPPLQPPAHPGAAACSGSHKGFVVKRLRVKGLGYGACLSSSSVASSSGWCGLAKA